MSDVGVDVDQLRKGLKRTQTKLRRHHDRFTKMLAEDSPATTDFYILEEAYKSVEALHKDYSRKADELEGEEEDAAKATEDEGNYEAFQELMIATKFVIKLLLSKRAVHRAMTSLETEVDILNKAFMAKPRGDHSPAVAFIKEKATKLSAELEKTNLKDEDPLIIQSRGVQEKASLVQAKVTETLMPDVRPDYSVKPHTKEGTKSGFKLPQMVVPTFSGELADWQSFWNAFKTSIHDSVEFSKTAKLHHLREAMKDKALYRRLSKSDPSEDFYDEAIAELKKSFDKPKQLHLRYIKDVVNMGPVQPTKAALNKCADVLRDSLDGLEKSKQTDVTYIFSSLVADLLPPKLANAWAERTETTREVTSARDLITFLKAKADQPYFHEVYAGSSHPPEKKAYKQAKIRGSAHVAVAQPQPQPAPVPQLVSQPNAQPQSSNRGQQRKSKNAPLTPCRYSCPSCSELHYAFSCSSFRSMTVPQRTEYVRKHSLCSTCLKPGHCPADCRSKYLCNVCQGAHSTFLHTEQPAVTTAAPVGTTNLSTDAVKPDSSLHKKKLMMTCMAKATGPTGETMSVRALLDSGADVSSVTSQVAKQLKLQKLDAVMAIETFGDSRTNTYLPTANFVLSSLSSPDDWSIQVTAAIIDKITSHYPKEDASVVKEMSAVQGLDPADPLFHIPGRIDVLLGIDVLPGVLSADDSNSSILAVKTRFGHAFMGTYGETPPAGVFPSTIQLTKGERAEKPPPSDPENNI